MTQQVVRLVGVVASMAVLSIIPARADEPPGETRSRSASDWAAARPALRDKLVAEAASMPPTPKGVALVEHRLERAAESTIIRFAFEEETLGRAQGVLALPSGNPPEEGWPTVLFLAERRDRSVAGLLGPAPFGRPRVEELTAAGYAAVAVDYAAGLDADRLRDGAFLLRGDLLTLRRLRGIPMPGHVDETRIAVIGIGEGARRAIRLTAATDGVACAVAVGGWGGLAKGLTDSEVLALCAPRRLATYVGDSDAGAPIEAVRVATAEAKRIYGLLGHSGRYSYTIFGRCGAGETPLEWEMALEVLDKAFRAQGPKPLPHAPEAEPRPDAGWVDPAADGLGAWRLEMAQRATTWTLHDGVIRCEPGEDEYGWLRIPDEFDDFEMTLEWRVPPGGNSGLFVRAKSVPWTEPTTPEGKERVSTKGLEWPSRTGLELQMGDEREATKYTTGSLYRHSAPAENPVKPGGEWNRYTVRCRGPRVEIWLNGRQVQDTDITTLPTLRKPPLRGYVGLQNHGSPAEFRNIRHRKLSASVPGR